MAQFNMRTDSVDVEKIMHRIRARIREKRGIDYTDDEVRELAAVKLERFLDPKAVRSDLIEQYRKRRPSTSFENIEFEDDTIYASSRGLGGRLIRAVRRLLNPLLKLFFNPNPIIAVLHMQGRINATFARQREETDALNFEILNNMVVEMTRLGIEVKNLKMQVESMSSRLDFDERRARALEGAVQYRPGATRPAAPPLPAAPTATTASAVASEDATATSSRPKRRRRRGRRRGAVRSDAPMDSAPSGEVDGERDDATEASDSGTTTEGADGHEAPNADHAPAGSPDTSRAGATPRADGPSGANES